MIDEKSKGLETTHVDKVNCSLLVIFPLNLHTLKVWFVGCHGDVGGDIGEPTLVSVTQVNMNDWDMQ